MATVSAAATAVSFAALVVDCCPRCRRRHRCRRQRVAIAVGVVMVNIK